MPQTQYANVPSTTTTGSSGTTAPASGTVETWTVASSAGFPAASSSASPPTQFHIGDPAANSEMITVTNVSGTTWTVTRGTDSPATPSTTPVAHATGATFVLVVTAGDYGQLRDHVDWVNAVSYYGADNTNASDASAAMKSAAAGGGVVYLPAGTYSANSGTVIAIGVAGTKLRGDGPALTVLSIGGTFSGAEVIAITAPFCEVSDLSIIGAAGTVTAVPAANGIEITGAQHCKVRNVFFQYVNGWSIESVATASHANLDTMIESVTGRNVAAGIHVKGLAASNNDGEHFLTDIQFQQLGAASGASANLDGILLEDVHDILTENLNVGVTAGTGSAVHVKGTCASCYFTDPDVGGGTGAVKIDDSANGSPVDIRFANGTFQQSNAGPGLFVSGGADDLGFTEIYFHRNWQDGIQASSTGRAVLAGCWWNTNNQGTISPAYDINLNSATGKWVVDGGIPFTAVGTASSQVTNPVNDPNSVAIFTGTDFAGGGVTANNLCPAGQTLALRACQVAAGIHGAGGWYACPPSQYAPGTQNSLAVSSGTMTAFSSANINTGAFLAPASGTVCVEAYFTMQVSAAGDAVALGLAAHATTSPVVGLETVWKDPVTTQPFPHVFKTLVSGLTPGTSYNFDLLGAIGSGGTVTVIANSQSGTAPTLSNAGVGGPVIMEVRNV